MVDNQAIYLPEFVDCKFCSFPAHREVCKVATKNTHLSGVLSSQLFQRSFASCQNNDIVGFRSSKQELGDCESNPCYGQNVSAVVVRPACEYKPREAPVIMIVLENMAELVVTKGSWGFALSHLESRK